MRAAVHRAQLALRTAVPAAHARALSSTPPSSSSSSPSSTKASRRKRAQAALTSHREQGEVRFNYLPTSSPFDPQPDDPNAASYRLVQAKDLVRLHEPPKRVRMLARDFIEDSLYNPNYGYFATKVEIFDPDVAKLRSTTSSSSTSSSSSPSRPSTSATTKGKARDVELQAAERAEGFDFGSFRNTAQFDDEVARRYMVFEGRGSGHDGEGEGAAVMGQGVGRQVWHTPTELFKVRLLALARTLPLSRPQKLTLLFPRPPAALVRPSARPPPVRVVQAQPVPVQRPHHLRDRRRQRHAHGRHPRLPRRARARRVRAHQVPHHRDLGAPPGHAARAGAGRLGRPRARWGWRSGRARQGEGEAQGPRGQGRDHRTEHL